LLSLSAAAARAQGAFGPGTQYTTIPIAAFRPESSSVAFTYNYGSVTPSIIELAGFVAPLGLPDGAVLEEVRLLVSDTEPGQDILAQIVMFGQAVAGTLTCSSTYWYNNSSGIFGRDILKLTGTPIVIQSRIDKSSCSNTDIYSQYYVEVLMGTPNESFSGAVLVWHRQMSPAPATATFNDVPTSDPYFRAIEALAASGITSGCGGGNFCPNDVVTRSQLAKFLAVALGLHFPQ